MKTGLRWEKYRSLHVGVDLWLDGGNIARVLKRGPKEYHWFQLGHGSASGECETLREAKDKAEQAVLDYATHVKVALEVHRAKRR